MYRWIDDKQEHLKAKDNKMRSKKAEMVMYAEENGFYCWFCSLGVQNTK